MRLTLHSERFNTEEIRARKEKEKKKEWARVRGRWCCTCHQEKAHVTCHTFQTGQRHYFKMACSSLEIILVPL